MIMVLIGLPIVIMLISAGFLFIDIKKPKALIFVGSLGLLNVILLGLFIFLATQLHADQQVLANKISEQEQKISQSLDTNKMIMARLSIAPDQAQDAIKKSILFGLTPRNSFFKSIEEADNFLAQLTQNKSARKRQPISVWQVPEELNQNLVKQTLAQYGYKAFYVPNPDIEPEPDDKPKSLEDMTTEEADGTLTLSLNFQDPPKMRTQQEALPEGIEPLVSGNLLSLGRRVSTHDAKVVALVLMRAGMNLKYIKRNRKSTRKSDSAIIVTYNKMYDRRASLSAERVANYKQFR